MTDNEIIKALERCTQHTECCYCNSLEECGNKRILTTSVIDLINRQKAEIERLKDENKSIRYCYEQAKAYNDTLAESCEKNCKKFNMTTRAEAIKEFAERLKHFIIPQKADGYTREIVLKRDIDNLVKEMTEER